MKGPIFPKVVAVHESGITADLLPMLQSLEVTIQETLSHMRDVASKEFIAAAESDATYEELKEKEEAVTNIDSLIHNAFKFMSGIDEELSKGEDSTIIIDHETSKQTGVTHITLSSVNQWANKKYGISILENQEHNTSADNYPVKPTKPDMVEDANPETAPLGTLEKNMLTTLAFLVDAFFEQVKKRKITKFIYNDGPNVTQIAGHLADLAAKASPGNKISGQTQENIRKLIAKAMKEKNSRIS